jgi:hypothetical protein
MSETCIAPRGVGDRTLCPDGREPGSLFCRRHESAPAAQRGGWLSAEKRRRKMAGSATSTLDASQVFTRLWVGGRPPFDRDLPAFDLLVLCAQELQPERVAFHGRTLRCPVPDSRLETPQIARVLSTSRVVAEALTHGQRILVTCSAGINRSALVASMAIARVTRMSADELELLMRRARSPQALGNQHFRELIVNLVGSGRARYQ